jgi:hypothetical protein
MLIPAAVQATWKAGRGTIINSSSIGARMSVRDERAC